ncbi:glycoside hydrolase family 76 protein [Catenuloplanes japonicus]|uniref:glycoside hydrolase family 76 protein n=1 Tax=Catenuloplanes japonicus TaxID=33876 RepID=UPI00052529E1|nr:glycoside hydrolase family 76 protein [Catenuloplanes japonicus]
MLHSTRLAATAGFVALLVGSASAVPAQAATNWTSRATSAYQALQQHLYADPLYRENHPQQPTDNPYSYLWPYREAITAALSLHDAPGSEAVSRRDLATRFDNVNAYWTGTPGRAGYQSYVTPPLGAGGDLFYDDNAIVGLEFVRGFHATGDARFIPHAVNALKAVERGWDTDTTRPCPGGQKWVESDTNTFRAANVTGLGAQLAAHLYLIRHQRADLEFARKLFDWNQRCLQQSPGLYWNDISYTGTINTTLWTYNSGSMIAAATLLYRATHNLAYLRDAVSEAEGALDYWTTGDRLYQQPAIFNAYLLNDLLLLHSEAPNPRYRAVFEKYAARLWSDNRDPATGLFYFQTSGGGAPDPANVPAQTLEQAAAVQIFAALAWRPSDYWRIA